VGAAALLVATTLPGGATALEIGWSTLDGGGGRSLAGSLVLHGSVAQPDAGALAGGSFVLRGGFWAAAGLTATGAGTAPGEPGRPPAFRLGAGAPNPFRRSTSLRFALPHDARTSLKVYDVAGRLVRTLVDADLPAGRHDAAWDGRDGEGRRTASGVYLLRMQAGTFGAVRKLVRIE